MMIACDWTYDMFLDDAMAYKATPIKGVHCSSDASYRKQFMVWFKNCARDFKDAWLKDHKFIYDRYDGYIGDAFAKRLSDMCFSDFYKDTYGQRPHLPAWFYVHAIGFPMNEDIARTFCATPVEDAVDDAKRNRESF